MLFVELVESALCGWFHVKILGIPARIGPEEGYMNRELTCRVAASFNKHMQSDKVPAAREVEQGHESLHWVRSPS
jgi:hypothetical protein